MAMHIIEGTWEDIERHKGELVGRYLRLTIMPERPVSNKLNSESINPPAPSSPKVLRGMGAFKGKTGGSEAFAREKRIEVEREDRID